MVDRQHASTWFGQHSGVAVFAVGVVVVIAALFGNPQQSALVLGGSMVVVGALIPRLGKIRSLKIGALLHLELEVAKRLDAARHEAELRAPGHEEEAIGRAFEALLPQLRAVGVLPAADSRESDGAPPSAPVRAGVPAPGRRFPWPRWGGAVVGAAAAVVAVSVLVPVLVMSPDEEVFGERLPNDPSDRPFEDLSEEHDGAEDDTGVVEELADAPPQDAEEEHEGPADDAGVPDDRSDDAAESPPTGAQSDPRAIWLMAVVVALVVAAGLGVAWLFRRRGRTIGATTPRGVSSTFDEAPPEFARRIVDDLLDEDPGHGAADATGDSLRKPVSS